MTLAFVKQSKTRMPATSVYSTKFALSCMFDIFLS